jgi:YesN/AraC family two-component response regulator
MLKLLIIEDEIPALNRITKLVYELKMDIEIIGTADSIESAVNFIEAIDGYRIGRWTKFRNLQAN